MTIIGNNNANTITNVRRENSGLAVSRGNALQYNLCVSHTGGQDCTIRAFSKRAATRFFCTLRFCYVSNKIRFETIVTTAETRDLKYTH